MLVSYYTRERLLRQLTDGALEGNLRTSVYGVPNNDGSVLTSSSNSDGAIRDELIDTDDTVEIIDAERVSVTSGGTNSLGTRKGEYWLGSRESVDGVGVRSGDGVDGSVGGDSGLAAVIGVTGVAETEM